MPTDAGGKVIAWIELRLDRLNQGVKKAVRSVKTMGSKIVHTSKEDGKAMAKEWAAGFAILTLAAFKAAKAVNRAFADMTQTFATFEQSLANTQSVAQANTEELLAMEEAARRVGATTRSTASEAANALYYLASAGFSAAESIAALDGVNALAIATQSDLARTSETVATTIRQYNLETAAATDIANTFTAAITNSLATMEKLTKSFEYVGPIAAGLGLTVEETTGALQLLYNKGFSGEKAGRGLRTILVNLADSTSVVTKRLAKLGITFDEINPTTNELADIFDTLREHEVDATNAAAIFGKVSGVQLASLIAQSSRAKGGIVELTEAVTGTNRAFEAMAIQMDTLQGSIDKFKNAEEALKISLGTGFEPVLRKTVDTATEFVKTLNKAPQWLLTVGTAVGVIAANAVAAGFALKTLGIILAKLGAVTFLASASLASLIIPLALIVAGIATALLASQKLNDMKMKQYSEQFGEIAEELNIANEELAEFYSISRRIRGQAGFVSRKDVETVDALRKTIAKLAEQYGVTEEAALKIAKTSQRFSSRAKESLLVLEQQIRAEKSLTTATLERADALINTELIYLSHLERIAYLKKLEEEKDQARVRNTAEAYESLQLAFERAKQFQKAYGDEFDRNKFLIDAFNKSMDLLINQNLPHEGKEIQNLIRLYKLWQDDTEAVGQAGKTSAQVRTEVLTKLKEELAAINGLEQVNLDKNVEYNAEKERSKVVTKALNALLLEGYLLEDATLTNFLLDYGDKIIAIKDTVSVTQEYIDKLERLNKTEVGLNEIAREAAVKKAEEDTDAIIAINEYHKAVEDSMLATQKAALDYTQKLDEQFATEMELIEAERLRAIASVEASDLSQDEMDKLIAKIDLFFGRLKKKEAWEQFKDNAETVTGYVVDYVSAITDLMRLNYDERIAMEEELLQAKLDDIDEAEQRALASAGLLEETERERLQRLLAEEVAIGDAIAIAEAENNLERYEK